MQEKNVCWRGHGRAVLGPYFAVKVFWTWTVCHEQSDIFPKLQAASSIQPEPTGSDLWLPLLHQSTGAVSTRPHQHTPESVLTMSPLRFFQVLAKIGGIPSSMCPGLINGYDRNQKYLNKADMSQLKGAENRSMGMSSNNKAGLEGGTVLHLAVLLLLLSTRKNQCLVGKFMWYKLGLLMLTAEANLYWRGGMTVSVCTT